MTASANPMTPTMKLPLRETIPDDTIDSFVKQVSKLTLSQVVERVTVTEKLSGKTAEAGNSRLRTYTVLIDFYPPEEYTKEYQITSEQLHESLAFNFAAKLKKEIIVEIKAAQKSLAQDLTGVGKGLKVKAGEDEVSGETDADDQVIRRGRDDELDNDDEDSGELKRKFQSVQHEYGADDESENGIGDLEDYVEKQMDDNDAPDDGDEDGVAPLARAQAEAKADLLAEAFKAAAKYATSFSFDVHGGKSAQFDLQVS